MSPRLSAKSSSPRPTAQVNSRLDKSLAAYMAAAGAAGVSILAVSQSAEAKVVYTPTNVLVNSSIPVPIDLNNDGTADFELVRFDPSFGHSIWLAAGPAVAGNAIRGNGAGAAPGFFGVPVGGGGEFATNTSYFGHGLFMAKFFQYSHSSFTGPWAGVTNRYLGFKFLINGQTHYGWARVSVSNIYDVLLTGYAYETTPNKAIIEGHISGSEKASNIAPADLLAPSDQPVCLGLLARGADTLSIWRREDETATN